MGTERREGNPFTVEIGWGAEDTLTHALEVHRTSDTVTYLVEGEPKVHFTVEQFEDLMRMASTIDYLRQPGLAEAKAEALEDAAADTKARGDIGKDGGIEAWTYLAWKAQQTREKSKTGDEYK